MTQEEFTGKAIVELIQSGVTVKFNKHTYYSKHAYNYFLGNDKNPKMLINCLGRETSYWFPIFIHEYCHFLQWKEDKVKWKTYDQHCTLFFDYIEGKIDYISDETVEKVQELEMDCDKRAMKLIDELQLEVNLDEYIQYANIYYISHGLMKKYKEFFFPYAPEVLIGMPKTLVDIDKSRIYARIIEEKYQQYLFKARKQRKTRAY